MAGTVVFVTSRDPATGMGGGPSYARVHALAARRAGFDPHLFCPAARGGIERTPLGVVHRVPSPFHRYGSALSAVHTPPLARAVERFLAGRPGPHLIHSFIWWRVGVVARDRLRRRGVRAAAVNGLFTTADHEARAKVRGLGDAHGSAARLGFRAELLWTRLVVEREERAVYRRADLLTYNYESVRRLFADRHGPGAELVRLPYTSESAFRPDSDDPPRPPPPGLAGLRPAAAPLVVAASRHDPRKGVDLLLRALARLKAEGVPFRACLVGGGPLLEDHRALARRLELADAVAVPGWVPDPFDYLRHADVFALPSTQEGSGSLALIEALQAGLPAVVSDLDGIPEDVTGGVSALLVPPGRVEPLAAALGRVLTDAALRGRLAAGARAAFAGRFSPAAFADSLARTYARFGVTPP